MIVKQADKIKGMSPTFSPAKMYCAVHVHVVADRIIDKTGRYRDLS